MTIVQIAYQNNNVTEPVPGDWNAALGADSTGQKIADLIDSTGASTGLSLWVTAAFTGSASAGGSATMDAFGVPEQAWQKWWYSNVGSAVEIRGFAPGQTGTIKAAGDGGNGARDSDYSVNGGTAVRYDANGGEPFTAPVSIPFTADGSGVVSFSGAVVNTFWYLNWNTIEFTETAILSITAAEDITSEGDTVAFALSGNSGAPTGVTMNGTDVGTLTDEGSGVYSYTATLIADDATADLVVSVDSTTVATVIDYANSYLYELVTHGTPDANSAFLNTQFATNGPVEWGVVADFDSGIVVVDWAAMDAAEDEINDIDLHATEVAAGTTTATLKYFVPESGATGTFNVVLTVSEEVSSAITSISVPIAGTYIAGENLDFTVNWPELVDVTGTPGLNINVGGARQANYVSGSGTSALLFRYTVQPGDNAASISVTSLTLNGGSIVDQASTPNAAVLTLNGVGDTSGIAVDTLAPAISLNSITTTNTAPLLSGSAGDAVSLTLVVTGVGTYSITPSAGAWSQQLPTLALGDYPMTLDGVDAAGNAAVTRNATLSIVTEIVSAANGLFQSLFTDLETEQSSTLFR
ncbi:MAG: hypothetical protein R3180_00175 [Marinobacter sp.]|nr:hypothetical protein [Marinobacter sp.]